MLGLFAGFGAGGWSRDGDAPASAEYTREQRDNAAIIVSAGRDLGLSERDQTIAVMTAMGESSLRNLDYGDWETSGVTNPDGSRTTSIGLFQQQDGWGTRDERLDPYTAAVLFYRAMVARVPDRDGLEPTEVAHRTQINRDRDHYAPYWPRAVALVDELSGQGDAAAERVEGLRDSAAQRTDGLVSFHFSMPCTIQNAQNSTSAAASASSTTGTSSVFT